MFSFHRKYSRLIWLVIALLMAFTPLATAKAAGVAQASDYLPTLLTPVDQSRVNINRPVFNWTEVAGASGYKLLISTSPDYSGWAYEFKTKAPGYQPTFDFPVGKTFYWKVKPLGISPSIYTDSFSFHSASPLVAPALDRPLDGYRVDSLTPVLHWLAVKDAVKYELQIAADSSFSQSVSRVDTVSTLYLFEKPLAANQTWFWRVRDVDVDGDLSKWSETRSFHTKMDAPVLVSPANDSSVKTARPTFGWQVVDGAKSYTLFVSLDKTFSEGTRSWTLAGTSFTPAEDLARDFTIYWRVVAHGNGDSASSTWQFEGANPPSVPVLVHPQKNTSLVSTGLEFNWSKVNRAAGYDIQISSDSKFSEPVITLQASANKTTLTADLLKSGVWYWRVRSFSADGDTSLWSTAVKFTVKPYSSLPIICVRKETGNEKDGPGEPSFYLSKSLS
jgi:hypothetical protein